MRKSTVNQVHRKAGKRRRTARNTSAPRRISNCLIKAGGKLAHILRHAATHAEAERELMQDWPDDARKHCRLGGHRDGHIVLLVDSSAWATRLRYSLPELKESATLLRDAQKIRVKVRPVPCEPKEPPRRKPNRMSKSASDAILSCSQSIPDQSLSAALRRLAEHGAQKH